MNYQRSLGILPDKHRSTGALPASLPSISPGDGLGVCARSGAGQEAYFQQNDPHPLPAPQPSRQAGDPLPSDGRGNRQLRLSQLPKRLDTPTSGGRFSLSHPMVEGRGEGESASKSA